MFTKKELEEKLKNHIKDIDKKINEIKKDKRVAYFNKKFVIDCLEKGKSEWGKFLNKE